MPEGGGSLKSWKQGDFCIDVKAVPFLLNLEQFQDFDVEAIVAVSNTCDIIRDYDSRPFIQFAAGLIATPDEIAQIKKHKRPRYAYAPGLAQHGLVVDLDVVITVDKKMVLNLARLEGCPNAKAEYQFSFAVARHRGRFAFPNSVSEGLEKLRSWVDKKSGKNGDDGQFLKFVEQFRLSVENLEEPKGAEFLCLLMSGWDQKQRATWVEKMIPKMESLVANWCADASFRIVDPSEISVAEYKSGARLDFDALSMG